MRTTPCGKKETYIYQNNNDVNMSNKPYIFLGMLAMITIALFIFIALVFANNNAVAEEKALNEDWPTFRLDLSHSGYKFGRAPNSNLTEWIFDTGSTRWVVSSPMIVDNHVFIGSDNGFLYKIDEDTGTEVWRYRAGSGTLAQFWSSPCVDLENNMVFCHASGVHAINLTTGEQIWHFDTNTREFSSPVVHNGVVFVGSYDKHVYALPQFDPNSDGTISENEIIWRYQAGEYQNGNHVEGTGGAVSSTLAIVDDMVIGAEQTNYDEGNNYCDYNIFVLPEEDPDDSGYIEHDEIIWKYEIGTHVPIIDTGIPGDNGDCFSSASVNLDLEQIYIGSRDMYMYAFELYPEGDGLDNDGDGLWDNEGELVWRQQVDNEVFSSPSIHDSVIYFGTGEYSTGSTSPGSVYALREVDGSEVWRYQHDDGFLSSALIADDKVFMGSNNDYLFAFDEESGNVIWDYFAEGGSQNAFGSSPSLYKGRIVVGCCNGKVYSFLEENYPPSVFLIYPDTEFVSRDIELEWVGMDWDEGDQERLTYDVYLDTNYDDVSNSLESSLVSKNQKEMSFKPDLVEGEVYYWKIIADDTELEGESEIWSFTVNRKPQLSGFSPEDKVRIVSTSIRLSWDGKDDDNDKLVYDVYFGKTSKVENVSSNQKDEYYDVSELMTGETYYWKIIVKDGTDNVTSTILSFTVNAPPQIILVSPEDSQKTDTTVTLKWNGKDDDNDDLKYDIYLDKFSSPTEIIANDITTDFYEISDLEEGEEYYWKVAVTDGYKGIESEIYNFVINNKPSISLTDPGNKTILSNPSVTLFWSGDDDDDDPLLYDLYFGTELYDEPNVINLTDESFMITDLIEGETYFWRVVVKDDFSNITSETWLFEINNPPEIMIVGPTEGKRVISKTLILYWEGSDEDFDYLYYDVYVDTYSIPNTIVSLNQEDEFYEVENLEKGLEYFWKVVIKDGSTEKSSDIRTFTVNSPPKITLKKPNDEEEISGTEVRLIWIAEDNENDDLEFDVYLDDKISPKKRVSSGQTEEYIDIDDLIGGETYYWKIVANDGFEEGYSIVQEFSLDEQITESDLSIDIEFSKTDVIEDEEVMIIVTVHNNGLFQLKNVGVYFFDGDPLNGLLIDTKKVTINANSKAIVTGSWESEEGMHTIYILIEYEEESKMVYKSITVKEKSPTKKVDDSKIFWFDDNTELMWYTLPSIAIAIVLVIGMVVSSRSSPKKKSHRRCPNCRSIMEYAVDYHDYYCYDCEEYLEDM